MTDELSNRKPHGFSMNCTITKKLILYALKSLLNYGKYFQNKFNHVFNRIYLAIQKWAFQKHLFIFKSLIEIQILLYSLEIGKCMLKNELLF